MNRRSIELAAAGIFAALFAFLFLTGIGYPGRSAYMPAAASGIGFLMCCLWALKAGRLLAHGEAEPLDSTASDLFRFVLILISAAAYLAGFVWLGFFTSTVIMVPAMAWFLEYREPKVIALATLGFTIVLYLVFRMLLAVPLPKEAILSVLGA